MEDWRGRTLSKVKIHSLVARGGMASVYLGEHTTLKKPMALKILHDHLMDTSDILARFKAEAQSVAALRHPHIVQVFDFDTVDDRPYIVMEYVRGITFSSYLNDLHQRELRLPMETIGRLTLALASALDYAHERGIIHRDIKPANIILRQGKSTIQKGQPIPSDAEPILTDFGIARIRDATTQTATGTILGTPAYMSPEQVAGASLDHRTDIYSLGIILYEMFAGGPPFKSESDTPVSILMKQLDEEPPELVQVSPRVQSVVDRALAKDPDQRYQWAGGMANALSQAIKPELTSILRSSRIAEQETLPSKSGFEGIDREPKSAGVQGWRRFRTLGLGALGLIGLVIVVALVLAGGGSPDSIERPTSVETPLAVVGAGSSPSAPPPSPTADQVPPSEPAVIISPLSGEMTFQDDVFHATFHSLDPPPSGLTYRAWLIGENEEGLEMLTNLNATGSVQFNQGTLTVEYVDPQGSTLLARYQAFVLTLDPDGEQIDSPEHPVYETQFDPNLLARVRLIDDEMSGEALTPNLLDWLSRQAQHFVDHARNATNSINANSLAGAKQHAEHTINILEGREGGLYADWDNNGRVENPGDEVGLLNYMRTLRDIAQGLSAAGDDDDGLALATRDEMDALIEMVTDSRETARQIALADSLDLIVDLGLDQEIEAAIAFGDQVIRLAQQAQALDLRLHILISPPEN